MSSEATGGVQQGHTRLRQMAGYIDELAHAVEKGKQSGLEPPTRCSSRSPPPPSSRSLTMDTVRSSPRS